MAAARKRRRATASTGDPSDRISRGIVPFVLLQLAGLLLVVWFGRPLVFWLPALVYGR